jgi:hypothetical protein
MNSATTNFSRAVAAILLCRDLLTRVQRVDCPCARRDFQSLHGQATRAAIPLPPQLNARAVMDRENPLLPCIRAVRFPT